MRQGLTVLSNLDHRGARGCEINTGDGAGILLQVPDRLLREEMSAAEVDLPAPGRYGVGMVFLPPDDEHRLPCEQRLTQIVEEEGLVVLGWRSTPLGDADLGHTARSCEPAMRQIFVGDADSEQGPSSAEAELALERRLYVVSKRAAHEIRHGGDGPGGDYFYCASFSCRTIVYKGMLTPAQVDGYYADLSDPRMAAQESLQASSRSSLGSSSGGDRDGTRLRALV